MRSFEIFLESDPQSPDDARVAPPRSGRRTRASDVLDLFIHGANVTARVSERHASCVLRDLAWALSELARAGTGKRIVRFYEDAWELCVERIGGDATLSVYRGGAEPTVLVYDRPVVFREMLDSVVDAIDGVLTRASQPPPVLADLTEVRRALDAARAIDVDTAVTRGELQSVAIDIDRDAPIGFSAEFSMRTRQIAKSEGDEPTVERADLHALLVRGRMRAEVRGRTLDLGEAYPFLFAERVLDLSRRALDAWERGQPFFARVDAAGVMIGLRAAAPGGSEAAPSSLTLTPAKGTQDVPSIATFPELSLFDVVEAVLAFGRALVRAVVRRDRAQGANLRLGAFRRDLKAAGDALREVRRQDTRINPAPESYRAFAQSVRSRAEGAAPAIGARLRYAQRWRALVPGIDLRATFLCGDRIVIGGALETFCLDRTTGELLWRKRTSRATSVVTPAGVARIGIDGQIALHDFNSGEVTLRTWIAPRQSGPCAGAVVSTPGLPRLLIVTEGERHLVALDLTTGEARWRYTWGSSSARGRDDGARGGSAALRLKRAGKLLYVASGDSALTAVDVQSGSVIWRVRDRLRFHTAQAVDKDGLYAVAGGAASAASLHAVDPYSGHVTWTARLPSSPCTVEGPPLLAGETVTTAIRDRRGLRLAAFDRATGKPAFTPNRSRRSGRPGFPSTTSSSATRRIARSSRSTPRAERSGGATRSSVRMTPTSRGSSSPSSGPARSSCRASTSTSSARATARTSRRSARATPSPISFAWTSAATSTSPRRAGTWWRSGPDRASRS
jgi:outer membrane protein assembly factor BamB